MIIAGITSFIYFTGNLKSELPQRFTSISSNEWDRIDIEHCGYADADEFIKDADTYFNQIGEFVHGEKWPDYFKETYDNTLIKFSFTEGISNAQNGLNVIRLKVLFFQYNLAPTAHEITHIVLQNSSQSLSEGFANYCQEKFGKNPTVQNFGIDIYAFSKLYKGEKFDDVKGTIGEGGIGVTLDDEFRPVFYNLSHSFVKYLIDTYGEEKFLELYKMPFSIDIYETVYSKNLSTLKEEWLTFIDSYDVTITKSDVRESINQTFLDHGMTNEMANQISDSMVSILD